jgi:VanZ family protein
LGLGGSDHYSVTGSSNPEAPNRRPPQPRTHFTIFALTDFAFGLGYKRRHHLLAILLVIFSSATEIAQLFVPGRHARLGDFIIDAPAACIGVVMASLLGLAPVRT